METVTENNAPPLPSAKTVEGEAKRNVPSVDKSVSIETPFQNYKAGNKPRMPGLSPVETGMHRCQNPCQAPFQATRFDQLRAEMDRHNELLYQSWLNHAHPFR